MIPAALVRTFIEQIASLRNAEKTKWSATRDVFETRLNDHSRKTRNWLFGAVIGKIGLNTFDHNYNFPEGAPKGLYCDFCHAGRYVVLLAGNAVCHIDGNGYSFEESDYTHTKNASASWKQEANMTVDMANFGEMLQSRPAGHEAFLGAAAYIFSALREDEPVILDFKSVKILAPSWADEFLTGLKSRYKNRIECVNTGNSSVSATLDFLSHPIEI